MNNSESTDIPPVIRKKVTEKEVEKWEVAQLKGDIVPCSRPSDLFEELEERRKARHEDVLHQLTADLQAINLKMENNVKLSSEELKAHMKFFNDKLQGIIQIIDVIEESTMDTTKFTEFKRQVKQCKIQQKALVEEFYLDLIQFENERSSENEKLLSTAFDKMTKIGYLLPYEIQTFLEQEVLALNQLTLNNRRNYERLRLTLMLLTEQTAKAFLDKADCLSEETIQRHLQKALLNMHHGNYERKMQNYRISEGFSVIDLRSDELVSEIAYDGNYYSRKSEDWLKKIEEIVVAIEFHGKDLIEVHKKIVSGIYQNFDEKAQCIKKELNELEILDVEELNVQTVMYYPEGELEELEMYWNDNISEIRMQLMHVNEFLKDVGRLWDRHADRIDESENLVLEAFDKANKKSQADIQDLEVKLNIALDCLRQEHTKEKLEECHEEVIAILNSIKSQYESMYITGASIIEDFYKMMTLEADVLSAEFKEFIYETQPLDPTRILHCVSDTHKFTLQGKHITRAIAGCAQRIRAVKQWQFGVWSAINALSDQTKETLNPRAEKWVQKKIDYLKDRKNVQLELLSKRFERIKTEIYEKRLREIKNHEMHLENYRKQIDRTISELEEDLDELVKRESGKLDSFKEELEKSQETANEENRPGIIFGKLKKAERNKEEFKKGLVSNFENFRANVYSRIFDLKQANIVLLESIKMFHEGGDYSSQEAKMYVAALEGMDKELEAELYNFQKESTKYESEIEQNIAPIFNPPIALMSSLYDETLFKVEVRGKLQFFQKELREAAEKLIGDVESLNKQTFCLYNYINNLRKPLDDKVCHFWNSVLRLLYVNMRYLFYPIEIQENLEESIKAEGESMEGEFILSGICPSSSSFTPKPMNFKKIIFRSGKTDPRFTCKDFKFELFGSSSPPENDGTFMGSVQNQLWTIFDAFQKAACAFYKDDSRKIIRTDLIPPNYETLIKDILNIFKSYNDQCEQFWLYTVRALLPVIAHLKQIANNYLERKLNEYGYRAETALKTLEEELEVCLDHLKNKTRNELDALDEKLLTLYGYPHNQDLLSCLEEEVVQRTAALGVVWETTIKKFKSGLKCFRNEHLIQKNDIQKLESHYAKLKNTLFVDDLGEGLLSTIKGYCDAGGFHPKDKLSNTSWRKSTITRAEDVPEEYDLKLNNKHDVRTIDWSLKYLNDLVEGEHLIGERVLEYPACRQGTVESLTVTEEGSSKIYVPAMHILLELLDFNDYAEEILKGLSIIFERLKMLAESKDRVHEEDLFKWLRKWKFSVKKLEKVYCVKSDEAPEPEKESSGEIGKFL